MNTNPIITATTDSEFTGDDTISTTNLHIRTRRAIRYVLGECPSYITVADARRVIAADLTQMRHIGVTFAAEIRKDLLGGIASADVGHTDAVGLLSEFHQRQLKIGMTELSERTAEAVEAALAVRPDELSAPLIATVLTESGSATSSVSERRRISVTSELMTEVAAVLQIAERPEDTVAQLVHRITASHLLPGQAAARFSIHEDVLRSVIAAAQDQAAIRLHRDWTAYDLAVSGLTLQQIADRLGITRERVRQLLARFGVNVKQLRAGREQDALQDRAAQRQLMFDIVNGFPGVTVDELRGLVNVSDNEFAKMLRPVRHLVLDTTDSGGDLEGRKARIITALRAAAAVETPLSGVRYDELVAHGIIDGPGRQAVAIVFGTWRQACAAAGVESVEPFRSHYDRVWSDDDIIETLAMFLVDNGSSSSVEAYEAWREQRRAPSAALVRNRYGGLWSKACAEALTALRNDWAGDDSHVDLTAVVAALCEDPDAQFGAGDTSDGIAA